jgi:hypothetical protein
VTEAGLFIFFISFGREYLFVVTGYACGGLLYFIYLISFDRE